MQIRELTPVFLNKAAQVSYAVHAIRSYLEGMRKLRDIWAAEIGDTDQPKNINVLSWMSRATLDIIGLAGWFTTLYLGDTRC